MNINDSNVVMEIEELLENAMSANEYLKESNSELKSMLIESQRITIELQQEHIAYQELRIEELMPFPDEDDEYRGYH